MMAMRMRLPEGGCPLSLTSRAPPGEAGAHLPRLPREAGEGSLPGEQAAEPVRASEHALAARHADGLHHEPVQQLAGGPAQRRTGGLRTAPAVSGKSRSTMDSEV